MRIGKMVRTRMYHRPGKFFVIVGHDLYDNNWGLTLCYGFRPEAPEGETAWRQVWRIAFAWPVTIWRRHAIPRQRAQ
jgi:hypothetical protein